MTKMLWLECKEDEPRFEEFVDDVDHMVFRKKAEKKAPKATLPVSKKKAGKKAPKASLSSPPPVSLAST